MIEQTLEMPTILVRVAGNGGDHEADPGRMELNQMSAEGRHGIGDSDTLKTRLFAAQAVNQRFIVEPATQVRTAVGGEALNQSDEARAGVRQRPPVIGAKLGGVTSGLGQGIVNQIALDFGRTKVEELYAPNILEHGVVQALGLVLRQQRPTPTA